MIRTRSLTVGLVVASATVLAATAVGVTYAATSLTTPKTVYACANAKGTLRLLIKGHCSTGFAKVGINKQGPPGPRGIQGIQGVPGVAGPGAIAVAVKSSSGSTLVEKQIPGAGLTMHVGCTPDSDAHLSLIDTDGTTTYDVNGSDQLAISGGGEASLDYNEIPHVVTAGLGPVEFTENAGQISYVNFWALLPSAGTAELTADVTVTRYGLTLLLHVHLFATTTHCVAQAWVTPTT